MESVKGQHGFDDSIFISETPEYVRCVVCLLVLRDPVQLLRCGHKLCSVCYNRIKKYAEDDETELRCPVDRTLVETQNVNEDIALKRLVGNLLVQCPREGDGCRWTGDLRYLDTHSAECHFKPELNAADCLSSDEMEELKTSLLEKDREILSLKKIQQQLEEQLQISYQQQEQLHLHKPSAFSEREGQAVDVKKQVLSMTKDVSFQHHCGDPSLATITCNNHRIEFRGLVTVSARNVLVPPRSKVWYEVVYTRCDWYGWNIVGWSTTNFPTSQTVAHDCVGGRAHSYGFKPFNGYKLHNGSQVWGKRYTSGKGAVGVALDLVRGEILFSVEGKWTPPMGVAFDIPKDKILFPAITGYNSVLYFNFGDRAFKYSPPDTTFKKLLDVV